MSIDLSKTSHQALFKEIEKRIITKEVGLGFNLQKQELWIVHRQMQGEKDQGILKWDLGKQGWKIVSSEDFNDYQNWKLKSLLDKKDWHNSNEEFLNFLVHKSQQKELKVGLTFNHSNPELIILNPQTANSITIPISTLLQEKETKWFK